MRILHLTTFLQGGAGLVIAALAAAQRKAGHDVVVITSATGAPGYGNYEGHLETLRSAGVDLHLVDSMFKRELADNLAVVAFVQRHFRNAGSFDIVHTHAAIPSVIAMILAGRSSARVPIVQTMHGWGMSKSAAQQKADVAVLNLVDRVVVPAETSAALLESLGVVQERIRIIPYGVAPLGERQGEPHPVEAEMREWQARGGQVVCCSGTLGERKNQRLLVEALASTDGARRPLCVFVGDGDASDLHALAARLGVADRVRFCGYREDARHIAAAADFFVLPSLSEGLPLSILEAFCDGVPVAASAIPEIREIVENGVTGLLFDPREPTDLARALLTAWHLTAEQRDALRANSRQQFESNLTEARMLERYMSTYDELRVAFSAPSEPLVR